MQRVSIVWIVPLVALAIAVGMAWQTYQDRGSVIEIRFEQASGITPEQTQLRYREVSVGVVEDLDFSDDLSHVIAHVRLDKDVEPFVDSESVFWVVQPEVSARGVTGLQTVLSGVYIEGSWDAVPGGLHTQFEGLQERPVARPDQEGTRIMLSSGSGKGLSEGAPILFKGLEVGRVGRPVLSADGITINAEAFINAPHDQLLTSQSRFWDASGVSFNIGTGGASVDIESLASLISGGVSFETVVSGGNPVRDGEVFAVFPNVDDARQSLFDGRKANGGTMELAMVFEENVTGLNVGAPVMLRGLQIGEVVGISGRVDPEQFGDDLVRLVVVLQIEMRKIDAAPDTDNPEDEREAILDMFEQAVSEGWRARLARSGLLTAALRIEMVQIPEVGPAEFQRDGDPYPIFPSVTAEVEGVDVAAEGLLKRVSDLPIEDLLNSAKVFLDNAAALVASEDIQSIPADVRGTVESIQGAVEDVREVIGTADLPALSGKVSGIADEFSQLLEHVADQEAVAKLVEAIEAASEAAVEISTAASGVPELVDQIEEVAEKVASVDLQGLMDQVGGLATNASDFLSSEATKSLPEVLTKSLASVEGAVAEATTLLSGMNSSGAVDSLTSALAKVDTAAGDIGDAVEGLPALIDEARQVTEKAAALDFETLVSEITGLVESAEAMIGTQAARELPQSLKMALDQVGQALAELRDGGTVAAVNAALASAERAATSVADASSELPALVQRTEAVLREAELALAGLADTGALNREARATLREVSRAADSVRSLARTLERKPNALLTGK
ncbi:PqiB family protein [Aliiruegeria sabulilitoris]|uniref:PqiB family protein n=1 Tax=Aliiruegeria sabulilitoris TaxID=1510458 RepID=UPI00082FD6C8|nr:MlaD family protein [Aliiruegeria sabulilitoris]NDR56968.1 MCE family protein [Pseudoruegeria sp. M32A2M]